MPRAVHYGTFLSQVLTMESFSTLIYSGGYPKLSVPFSGAILKALRIGEPHFQPPCIEPA